MSTLKVDTIEHETATSAIDMPNKFKVADAGIEQVYTSSATEPSDGEPGDIWWDSANEKIYRYIDGEFKELTGASGGGSSSGISWWGTRGMAVGGEVSGYSNKLEYIDITTLGNGTDFGDLTESTSKTSSGSNGSRGVRIGGQVNTATMDYWAFATAGNATDFGDALVGRNLSGSVADGTKVITGSSIEGGYKNDIEYITVATAGNGTDFGDMTGTAAGMLGTTNDTTRGIFAGTQGGTKAADSFEYITMSTPGNATDYGDLATTSTNGMVGVVSDNTYGVFMGGISGGYSNVIQYMTIQSSANGTDFGDLAQGRAYGGATSDASTKRGMAVGGYVNPGSGGVKLDSIEYITINSPGNATDFGDLTAATERASGCSGAAS